MQKKELKFTHPQLRFIINMLRGKHSTNILSRGNGKTFISGWLMKRIEKTMPQSKWGIEAKSFRQVWTNTIPSIKNALSSFGYDEGVHYLSGKKPSKILGFKMPHEPPHDWQNTIVFKSGCTFQLISQDSTIGGARSLNLDGKILDEAITTKKEKSDKEVSGAIRGNKRYFGHLPYHHAEFTFSSMPYGADGKWMLDQGNYYKDDFGLDYTELHHKRVSLQLEFMENKDIAYRMELWKKIDAVKSQIRYFPSKSKFFYQQADVFDNIENLGIDYIDDQYSKLTRFVFLVEMLNWFPDVIEHGFYPHLSRERHGYRGHNNNDYISSLEQDSEAIKQPDSRMDSDCMPTLPLRIAVDWGAKINCLSTTQYYSSISELRFLSNTYVKHPLTLDDLAKAWCTYYRHHPNKDVVFLYDHTGNTAQANSKHTYAQQFAKILTKHGWRVSMEGKLSGTPHMEKYLLWSKVLSGKAPLKVSFNLDRCNETFVSMSNAPAKEVGMGIEKNKSSERNAFIPQEEATHLSDTADLQLVAVSDGVLNNAASFIPNSF